VKLYPKPGTNPNQTKRELERWTDQPVLLAVWAKQRVRNGTEVKMDFQGRGGGALFSSSLLWPAGLHASMYSASAGSANLPGREKIECRLCINIGFSSTAVKRVRNHLNIEKLIGLAKGYLPLHNPTIAKKNGTNTTYDCASL